MTLEYRKWDGGEMGQDTEDSTGGRVGDQRVVMPEEDKPRKAE